jgi:type I restriction enzyme, S subunit
MSTKTKTTVPKEEATLALVPKLRFPEFRGTEGWQGVPLSELVSALDAGVSVNSGDRPATGNEIGVLKTSAVTNGIFEPQENKVVIDEVERGRVKEPVQGGTIIISRMNTPALVGANAYVEISLENIYLPDRLWAAKSKLGTSMRFVASILGSDKGRAALSKLAKGSSGSMKNITKPDVLAFLIEAPSPAEQQKIAECLSSVDELMAAQVRKVDALNTHKKGLMQQLFPREGETQPRLRFPEFQNAGEWEEGKLGPKASKVGSGITPTGGDKNYKQAGRPFVRSQNVGWGILLLDDVAHIDEETHASFDSTEIKVRDVLLNITGASIGRSAVANESIAGGNVNQHVCIIRTKPDSLNAFFLNQYLICQRGQKQIDSFQAGGNRQGLNFAQIRSFAIPLPPTFPEQKRIASCLSSLDALITAENQKHDALKTHKKGLMQQLFPSPKEVEV